MSASPLLGEPDREEQARNEWEDSRTPTAPSQDSRPSTSASKGSQRSGASDETTPLLSRSNDSLRNREQDTEGQSTKSRIRRPTVIALAILSSVAILILAFAFAAPAVAEEYAQEAVAFEPTNLSIESFTINGVNARVRGNFVVDGSRVRRKPVRDIGRFGTWIARAVESKPTKVQVCLPQYDNLVLGTANVPGITVSIRDGKVTPIDFVTEVSPGSFDGIRRIANDWLDGHLGSLRVAGKADVSIKSGLFSLGTQHLTHQVTFSNKDIPSIPKYEITKFLVHEVSIDEERAMAADVAIKAYNEYPVTFHIPGMAFDVLVPGCPTMGGDLVMLANATTQDIFVKPEQNIVANARGVVRTLPKLLVDMCPGTDTSPLDTLLGNYMRGSNATVYVRGSGTPHEGVPQWVTDFTKDVVAPVSVPGRTFNGLIRNFTMDQMQLSLPNPLADPDSREASPRISAIVKVVANLPKEMNFPVNITQIRADADVFYKGKQLGILDLKDWQSANSTRIYPHGDVPSGIAVDAAIEDAPLSITDEEVFTEVVEAMLFSRKGLTLTVKANVDVETHTALGKFVVRGIPAEGKVPVKHHGGPGFDMKALAPKIHSLEIVDSTRDSIILKAKVNMTNPTNYSAMVPYVDVNLLVNGTVLGHATATHVKIKPGRNSNIAVSAVWDPAGMGGEDARKISRDLISQYISGYNTTLQIKTHKDTIPALPMLGRALSNISFEIPTPRLKPPKNPNHDPNEDPDDDDEEPHFIQDTTMHLFSSTADFTLLSPLKHGTIFLTHINATALYNHTEPVGFILYDVPFAIPPGASKTPRLPVEYDVLSVGYDAIRQALGGTLKLDARAEVRLRLGQWEEMINFAGHGIGAHIRP